jgi:predicted dehydrogenase
MKLAIVGLGKIALSQIKAAAYMPADIQIVGGCDIDPSAKDKLPSGASFYPSITEMIQGSRPDVVLISTPNDRHYKDALEALAERQPIIIEKPMCEDREQRDELIGRAREQRTFLHVAFHAALAKDFLWWLDHKETLHAQLGELSRIHMGFFDPRVMKDRVIVPRRSGFGGAWFDSGINALSVLGRITDPTGLQLESSRMVASVQGTCVQISGSVQLSFPTEKDRCRVTIETDWTTDLDQKISTLFYERGTVVLNHSLQEVIVREGEMGAVVTQEQVGDGMERLVNHYIGVFTDLKKSFELDLDNSAHAVQLHELLYSALDMADRD